MRTRLFVAPIALLLLAAAALSAGPAVAADRGEIVVYSARIEHLIKPMFDAFTARTGIKVQAFSASEAELFERLKAEGAGTPADVLMTVDVGNLWLAQQAGLLQGFPSPVIEKNIPGHLRARTNEWVGLSVRARTIAHSTERVKPDDLSTYEGLGDPRWRGRLCLRTSKKVYNQSMVATMIKTLGEKRTEDVLRGWMANEPRIFASDTKLLEAIAAGQCDRAGQHLLPGPAQGQGTGLPGGALLAEPEGPRRPRQHLERRRDEVREAPRRRRQAARVPQLARAPEPLRRHQLRVPGQPGRQGERAPRGMGELQG
jgi:hypothetical protein